MAWEPLPTRDSGSADPSHIKDGLDRIVQSLGMPSADALQMVFYKWSEIVGPELAGQCQPTKLDKGRLVVVAKDQAWATQLRWLQREMIERCEDVLGPGVVERVLIKH